MLPAPIKRGLQWIANATLPLHGPLDRVASDLFGANRLVAVVAHLYGNEGKAQVRKKMEFLASKFTFLPVSEAFDKLEAGTLPRRAAIFTIDDVVASFVEEMEAIVIEMGFPVALAPIPGLIASKERYHYVSRLMRIAAPGTWSRTIAQVREAWVDVVGNEPDFSTYSELYSALGPLAIEQIEGLREKIGVPVQAFASWDDLRRISRATHVDFLSHSMSHPLMWHAAGEWLDYEVGESKRIIEEQLLIKVHDFAFPVGMSELATPAVRDSLRRFGYHRAMLVQYGAITPQTDPYLLPRVGFERELGSLNLATSKVLLRWVGSSRGRRRAS